MTNWRGGGTFSGVMDRAAQRCWLEIYGTEHKSYAEASKLVGRADTKEETI